MGTEEATENKKQFRKYTKAERRKLGAAIKRLLPAAGGSYKNVLPLLVHEGFTGPGEKPLLYQHVATVATQRGILSSIGKKRKGIRINRRSVDAPAPKEDALLVPKRGTNDDTATLVDLILDAELDADRKVDLIKRLRSR